MRSLDPDGLDGALAPARPRPPSEATVSPLPAPIAITPARVEQQAAAGPPPRATPPSARRAAWLVPAALVVVAGAALTSRYLHGAAFPPGGERRSPRPLLASLVRPAAPPLAPQVHVVTAPLVATVPARFSFNDASPHDLDPVAWAELRARLRSQCPLGAVSIVGYTCNRGDREMNRRMALDRARAVAKLLGDAVLPARLRIIAGGSADPVASNRTAEGRAANRRVVIACEPEPRSVP